MLAAGSSKAVQHIAGDVIAALVALRPRIGSCAVRPDPEAGAVKMQDGAAAGGHRMNQHHGRAHAHAGYLGFERALELAVVMGDVGGGAPHVESDELLEAGL